MAKTDETALAPGTTTDALLLAMLTLMIDERERAAQGNSSLAKTEVLLSGAGLGYRQIAGMMGKSPDAVRMMLARISKPKSSKKASKPTKEQGNG